MNYLDNPVSNLHTALAHAMYKGFPDVDYEDRDWEHYHKTKEDRRIKKSRRHTERDISVVGMFPQTWGSTSLGFGGIGGAAITSAYTTILESEQGCGHCVYFAGRFAYRIKRINEEFLKDMAGHNMTKVAEALERYERTNSRTG